MGNSTWYLKYMQTDLFGDEPDLTHIPLTPSNSKCFIGQYFEYLTTRVFPKAIKFNSTADVTPDLNLKISKKRNVMLEVKGTKEAFLFDFTQIEKYEDIQNTQFETIYYVLFIYKIKSITDCGSIYNLVRELNSSVQGCYIVPLDVIIKMVSYMKKHEYKNWTWGDRTHYYRLSYRLTNILSIGYKEAFRDMLFILSDGKYDVTKQFKISRFMVKPGKILICPITPFPVITLSNISWKKFII